MNPEKDRTEGRGTWQQRRRAWQRAGNASTIATCGDSDGRRLIRTPNQRAPSALGPRQVCTVPAILASDIWRDPTTESPSVSDAQLDRSSRVARRGANEGRLFEAVDEVARFELLDTGDGGLIARDLVRRVGAETTLLAAHDPTDARIEVLAAWGVTAGRGGLPRSPAEGFVRRRPPLRRPDSNPPLAGRVVPSGECGSSDQCWPGLRRPICRRSRG